MRTALRGKAYFAEDPALVPPASAYAAACVRLLSREGAGEPAIVHAQPARTSTPTLRVLS